MISINKDEAEALRARYGSRANVTITSRGKKGGRKRYYVDETDLILRFIERFRRGQTKRGEGVG